MEDILIPLGFFLMTYKIIDIILKSKNRGRLYKLLAEKQLNAGDVSDVVKSLDQVTENFTDKWASLKWAVVSIFTGMGLFLIDYLNRNMYDGDRFTSHQAFGAVGILSISVGLGFLVYFLIVYLRRNKD
ncbi:hypothetical protein K5X82_17815 [Halosquirtibacter xylanolyticus]|uniref:DUF6249 domain-containing protein n=1 Tax=Halosquirtibacter xylanolyticus TaxID=3374599 RepID=UPI0037490785|nr:hypothetical protein K5X82_17815 [Prolixibacteraceae bacterium]